jgi:hypothetical protein
MKSMTHRKQPQAITVIPGTAAERKRLLAEHRGLFYRLALRRRLDPGLLSRVYHGRATSARYRLALEAEISRRLAEQGMTEAA